MAPLIPPDLDEKSLEDLIEEIRKMLPQFTPEWTNHNDLEVRKLVEQLNEQTKIMDQLLVNLSARLQLVEQSKDNKERPKRNRFFKGKLLTEKDFEDEQKYFLEKHKRHNRYLHGCGVVSGLGISIKGSIVCIKPGFALDCEGNEIVVLEPVELDVPEDVSDMYVMLHYIEYATEPIPIPPGPADSKETTQSSRIEERFRITFEVDYPCHEHKRDKLGLHTCGKPHGIPLGKLIYRHGCWKIDSRFHRPSISS